MGKHEDPRKPAPAPERYHGKHREEDKPETRPVGNQDPSRRGLGNPKGRGTGR